MSSASHYPLRVTCIKHIKNWYWNIFRLGRFVGNKIPCFLIHKLTVVKSTVLFGRSLLTFKPSLDGRLRSWWTSCPQPSSWLGISPAVEISIGRNPRNNWDHPPCPGGVVWPLLSRAWAWARSDALKRFLPTRSNVSFRRAQTLPSDALKRFLPTRSTVCKGIFFLRARTC